MMEMAAMKNSICPIGSCSMRHENQMSGRLMSSEMVEASMNFTFTTRERPSGERPTIQSRLPSSENCGYTKRVVSVARFSAQAARFMKLTSLKK